MRWGEIGTVCVHYRAHTKADLPQCALQGVHWRLRLFVMPQVTTGMAFRGGGG